MLCVLGSSEAKKLSNHKKQNDLTNNLLCQNHEKAGAKGLVVITKVSLKYSLLHVC